MSAVSTTEIVIVPTDSAYSVPGDWEPSAIVSSYASAIPGLASMQSSVTTETRATGTVKIVTFTNRTGTKG